MRAESGERQNQGTREPRAESGERRAESGERRAESGEQGAGSREQENTASGRHRRAVESPLSRVRVYGRTENVCASAAFSHWDATGVWLSPPSPAQGIPVPKLYSTAS
jgi:hypothetical protein